MPGSRAPIRTVALALAVAFLALGACASPPPEPPDVVVLLLDTLRADRVGAFGHPDIRTPWLDRIARGGRTFTQATSTSSWTLPSSASLLTGLYPAAHRVTDVTIGISGRTRTAPEILADAGWDTAAFVSTNLVGSPYGFQRGFDRFDESNSLGHEHVSSPLLVELALAWARARAATAPDAPAFLLVHWYDPHWVYMPHRRLLDVPVPTDPDTGLPTSMALYEGEVRFTDRHVGALLRGLETLGLLDDAIVVLAADHGEALGQHGIDFHTETLYQELVHVPLAIDAPGRIVPGIEPAPVSMIHVLPTLLALAGRPELAEDMQGEPILDGRSDPGGRPVLSEVSWIPYRMEKRAADGTIPYDPAGVRFAKAVRVGDWKAIRIEIEDRWELYDLAVDPLELHDLAAVRPQRLAALQDAMAGTLLACDSIAADVTDAPEVSVSGELLEKLQALGYVE